MMILKEGVLKKDHQLYCGICPNCGCIIECYEEELSASDQKRPCPTQGCCHRIEMTKVESKEGCV